MNNTFKKTLNLNVNDYYLLRKYIWSSMLSLVIYSALSVYTNGFFFILNLFLIFTYSVSISINELSNESKCMMFAMPISPSDYIRSKYSGSVIITVLCLIVIYIAILSLDIFKGGQLEFSGHLFARINLFFLVTTLMISAYYPVYFKSGIFNAIICSVSTILVIYSIYLISLFLLVNFSERISFREFISVYGNPDNLLNRTTTFLIEKLNNIAIIMSNLIMSSIIYFISYKVSLKISRKYDICN